MKKKLISIAGAALLGLALAASGIAYAAHTHAAAPTTPATYTVTAGFGDRGGAANVFAPSVAEVYVGDTVTWKIGGNLEPHTITFGPQALLDKVAAVIVAPVPQKAGPPLLAINPKAALPTVGHTYDGTGFANSGWLHDKGRNWSLTFTAPGTFRYYCLIHYIPGQPARSMGGEVIVHPRPAASHHYIVSMGSAQDTRTNVAAIFNPRALTIHAGDAVTWIGGVHTVTFGPEAELQAVEAHFLVRVPQKAGPPLLTINPKAVLPAGGPAYTGTGWVSSGFLFPKGNAPAQYTLTFPKPGTYSYDCLVHPGMDGTITVLAAGM